MNSHNTNDFLAEIYRGANMGVQTINNLLMKVTDNTIYNELKYQLRSYEEIANEAYAEIMKRNSKPKDISMFDKMSAKMSIGINTFINNNSSHIADMLIKGNTMGVTGITKSLNSHSDADKEIKDLADRFVKLEQDNIDRLKKFL
ncbi:hypothetical protein J2Z76_002691 [Sedimentibacter acidaminivorans]|uniref:DUF2383 domain-containing protein n=1 Tax=Sedimentibacter acidaminivorans TaxID=913099 RepID=A0ABS4GGL4_9FIRM|nr:hypothetical protein [Sedimentibacter acidaminivorans]MBP1926821.1 hypothetical protein [Sedimentibacter acidaminivorans]